MVFGKLCGFWELQEERCFLRKKIFQGNTEFIYDKNPLVLHSILFEEDKPVAIGSLSIVENTAFLYGLGVVLEKRNLGYGDLIMRMLLQKAFVSGAVQIHCKVCKKQVPFFQKYAFFPTEKGQEEEGWQELACTEESACQCQCRGNKNA